ncbi:hypothetical protein CH272_24160 [Rhodococcus sp. 05-340-1]|uniref:hypothetical protein n=1 Tax=Nocardiaceae TaxID=85025 RepID=UPI00050CF9B8|nr:MULTISPECIES: hypothetical protein [Rhodococcus]AMY56388.1 hypothetical protein A3L23_05090 [Rhodococcus fascians D188]KQU45834.1 hypothetical protein ASG84_11050 [Rhodococcus sp. Leaf278]OZC94851.1 hypothetical protein CH275_28220 [Rhodococcus sp. 06-235-1A]OZD64735.1 hypothetical protein CH271_21005 [Rhodococcus sp. 05-340-2]OZD71673.1 hypothetical protein CH272_24160 [Rhodococcus sp. 05-340-1]
MADYTLLLPASGLVAQYRSDDDTMRVVPAAAVDSDLDWGSTTDLSTTDPESFPFELKQQVWPGDAPGPTWWVLITSLPPAVGVKAHAVDGEELAVLRMGPVTVIEWVSTPKTIIVTAGSHTHKISPFRSGSRGPAAYSFDEKPKSEDDNGVDFGRLD